jgi:2-polyprenyl-3-methyl-5-hydroxy-6-metoxy-1,4-benzoquinol methylase
MNTNFEAAKSYIARKRKDAHESLSGPGSHLANTKECVQFISDIIKNYNIKSILDLGCGDWNWFKQIELNSSSYEGWDACDQMISDNQKFYGCSDITFRAKDIVTQNYPHVDLIICRDVLFHMQTDIGTIITEKAKQACRYFISTSFNDVQNNIGIGKSSWGFYKINLNIEPFNLSKYLVSTIVETKNSHSGNSRMINFYDFNT